MALKTPQTGNSTYVLPAGWRRVYEAGAHKLEKRTGDLEVTVTDHCVGVDGDQLDRQGWRVDDPRAAAAELAWALDSLRSVDDSQDDRPLLTDGRGEATDEEGED